MMPVQRRSLGRVLALIVHSLFTVELSGFHRATVHLRRIVDVREVSCLFPQR